MDPYDNEQDSVDPLDAWDDESSSPLDDLADAADQATHPRARPAYVSPADRAPRDDDGRFDSDLPCIRCDYNLRGQLPEGSCPECGAPVAESLRSDRLSQSNLPWLLKIRRSMSWLLLGGASIILLGCFNGVASATITLDTLTAHAIVAVGFSIAQAVLFCVGYWLLTAPEPAVIRPRASRPITRWTAVPGYALSVPAAVLDMSNDINLLIAAGVIQIVSGVGVMIGFCASLIYLRHLARRIPDPGLAKQSSIVLWGWITTIGAFVLGLALFIALAANNTLTPGGGFDSMLLLFCPLALALLTFFIWWLVLISAFSRSFDRAVKAARKRLRASHHSA